MSVAVIERTFSIVEVMSRLGRPLALADITLESRLPKPTVYRLLKTLCSLGYVRQIDDRGHYTLTERLISLGQNDRYLGARQKAVPIMQRLHDLCNETVNLGLLEGIFVNYVHVIETTQPLRWIVKPGARDPFHTTALGRAIVSHFSPTEQQALIAKAFPEPKRSAQKKLLQTLATVRGTGWAIDDEESASGVVCLAISLHAFDEPLAAISVSVPAHRYSPALHEQITSEFSSLNQTATSARRKVV